LKIFGSRYYVLEAKTDKGFGGMGRMAIYIGHEEGSNAYKCYVPEINDFITTEDIRCIRSATDAYGKRVGFSSDREVVKIHKRVRFADNATDIQTNKWT
jgi:hypothetical protein